MGFFARPRLSNEQFVQHTDDVLTLSGQTRIATTTGLTLSNAGGAPIIITAEGATGVTAIGQVLTYDGIKITLSDSALSGSSTYNPPYKSPASIDLGGVASGTILTGRTINSILEELLVPTLSANTIAWGNSLSLLSATCGPLPTTIYEVGATVSIQMLSSFSRGFVSPQYCGTCCFPVGVPITHNYSANWNTCSVTSPALNLYTPYLTCITGPSTQPFWSQVDYSSGCTAIYCSDGSIQAPAEPSGQTGCVSDALCGVYPWYWGIITCAVPAGACRPSADCIKHEMTGNTCGGLTTGNKVVALSTATICANFNSTLDDYLWFATPAASTTKTKWWVSNLNCGTIGGVVSPAGNLFPAPDTVTGVTSVGTGSWSGQSYQVYVSNKQTPSTLTMQLRNS